MSYHLLPIISFTFDERLFRAPCARSRPERRTSSPKAMGILTDRTASTIARRPRRPTPAQMTFGGALTDASPGCPTGPSRRFRTQWRSALPERAPIHAFTRLWVWPGGDIDGLDRDGFEHRESGAKGAPTCARRQRSDRGLLILNAKRPVALATLASAGLAHAAAHHSAQLQLQTRDDRAGRGGPSSLRPLVRPASCLSFWPEFLPAVTSIAAARRFAQPANGAHRCLGRRLGLCRAPMLPLRNRFNRFSELRPPKGARQSSGFKDDTVSRGNLPCDTTLLRK